MITKCSCASFSCSAASDPVAVVRRETSPKKRSVLDELDELDEMVSKSRKRRAINLHELGSLAGMVKQKRDKMRK